MYTSYMLCGFLPLNIFALTYLKKKGGDWFHCNDEDPFVISLYGLHMKISLHQFEIIMLLFFVLISAVHPLLFL